jgi:DNA-binding response OmpR family regulator
LLSIALIAFVWFKSASSRTSSETKDAITRLGRFEFYEASGYLKYADNLVPLSRKESKLLKILDVKANRLVDRDHLQNEIWKSEGVITGRSLDMFVSKLRKKMSDDPSVKIVNVHGRGYKLETLS